ncbi:hypothetical protein [Rhizobium oryzicola]|uniref:HEAT repeat domain-containing protein n=1 Tax=Rhizobium oryzicola TaxID=1232668 RepID=A0ABT8SXB5_9HYPH|nr:hypothetical protein [Rhizobium oryzicola]MDO1582636.1 hypothetical protein [Rhizobium oryzicola]
MPANQTTYPQMMREAGYYCTNNSKTHYNVEFDPRTIWDDCSGAAHWANRPAGKPFLAVFNCMLTHKRCIFERQRGTVVPDDVTLPAHLPDCEALRTDLASYYNRILPVPGLPGRSLVDANAPSRSYAFSGRDRMDERYDLTRTLRSERYRYIRNYKPHRPWGQHYLYPWNANGYQAYETLALASQLTQAQARFWSAKPHEELYDMAADPDSLTNLADLPEYAQRLNDMRKALVEAMLVMRDGGFIPEGLSRSEMEICSDLAAYPLEDVIATAGRACGAEVASPENFIEGLSSPLAVLRYWNAVGLLVLAIRGTVLPEHVERIFTAETEVAIRIVLAEAIGQGGKPGPMIAWLTDMTAPHIHPRLRLQAITALTHLPHDPDISRPAIEVASLDSDEFVRNAATYLLALMDKRYSLEDKLFRYDLFLKQMRGHSGIGPQTFPELSPLRTAGSGIVTSGQPHSIAGRLSLQARTLTLSTKRSSRR